MAEQASRSSKKTIRETFLPECWQRTKCHGARHLFEVPCPPAMESTDTLQQQQALAALLQRRIDLIGDHAFRDRDAQAHLAALREVSEALDATFKTLKPQLPPRLRHFM